MVRTPLLATATLAASMAVASSANAAWLLNEAVINPSGTDDAREFVELRSTAPGTDSLSNLWLIEIETDGTTARGTIDLALNLGTATQTTPGSFNGYVLIGHNYATSGVPAAYSSLLPSGAKLVNLARPSTSTIEQDVNLLLVTNFTGTVGTDYDSTNDGVLDSTPWGSIVDAVTLKAANLPNYAGAATPQNSSGSGTVDGAARFVNDLDTFDTAAWFGGEILNDLEYAATASDRSSNFPDGYKFTPGSANLVPEPASLSLLALGGLAGLRRRRR